MKKIFTTLLSLFVLVVTASAANTWYTTGLSTDWNDAASWSADEVLIEQHGVPAADADIVVRHPMTMNLNTMYRHTGDLRIETEGILEVIGFGPESRFIFEGGSFVNTGILMVNVPVEIQNSSAVGISVFTLEEGAQTLLGSDLVLSGHVTLNILNGSCGATVVKGELLVDGERTAVLGQGSWIAEGGYRIWNQNGSEIIEVPQKEEALAAQMAKGLQLFDEINTCALGQRGISGTFVPGASNDIESESDTHLGLYPNPQTTGMMLNLDGSGFGQDEAVIIEIRTLMGQQVHSETQTANMEGDIQLQADWNLNPGQYVVSIRGSQHYATQRLVRQ